MALSKEQILGIRDIKIEELYIPEWEDTVYVKTMSAEERDKFEEAIFVREGNKRKADLVGLRTKMCAFVLCDEQGNRLFTEDEVQALSHKNANALTRIFEKAQEMSKMREGDLEDALKNSMSVRESGSSTD